MVRRDQFGNLATELSLHIYSSLEKQVWLLVTQINLSGPICTQKQVAIRGENFHKQSVMEFQPLFEHILLT